MQEHPRERAVSGVGSRVPTLNKVSRVLCGSVWAGRAELSVQRAPQSGSPCGCWVVREPTQQHPRFYRGDIIPSHLDPIKGFPAWPKGGIFLGGGTGGEVVIVLLPLEGFFFWLWLLKPLFLSTGEHLPGQGYWRG